MKRKLVRMHTPPMWFVLLGFLLSYITFATARSMECGTFSHLGFAVSGGFFILAWFQLVIIFCSSNKEKTKDGEQ